MFRLHQKSLMILVAWLLNWKLPRLWVSKNYFSLLCRHWVGVVTWTIAIVIWVTWVTLWLKDLNNVIEWRAIIDVKIN